MHGTYPCHLTHLEYGAQFNDRNEGLRQPKSHLCLLSYQLSHHVSPRSRGFGLTRVGAEILRLAFSGHSTVHVIYYVLRSLLYSKLSIHKSR